MQDRPILCIHETINRYLPTNRAIPLPNTSKLIANCGTRIKPPPKTNLTLQKPTSLRR